MNAGVHDLPEQLEDIGIDFENGLAYADNDLEFYKTLLNMFSQEYNERYEKVIEKYNEYKKNGDATEFVTIVHSLKGEARGIGAKFLGEAFYNLELAGKANNESDIDGSIERTMIFWKKVCLAIRNLSL